MRQLRHPRLEEVTLAGVLSALSDPVRLSVVSALADGAERGWGEFEVGVGASTLSHHIKVLREAGLVSFRRDGVRSSYVLNTAALEAVRADLERVTVMLAAAARPR